MNPLQQELTPLEQILHEAPLAQTFPDVGEAVGASDGEFVGAPVDISEPPEAAFLCSLFSFFLLSFSFCFVAAVTALSHFLHMLGSSLVICWISKHPQQ
jgi:hypothetical protein